MVSAAPASAAASGTSADSAPEPEPQPEPEPAAVAAWTYPGSRTASNTHPTSTKFSVTDRNSASGLHSTKTT